MQINEKYLAELDALNSNSVTKQYIWEPGGSRLLSAISYELSPKTYYALADANKNITEYIDASGVIQGHFEYSPFGKITVASGLMPDAFDYRFSSEYFDSETGLVYYNYRYYSPELGRWLSRDPIEEEGGENLYGMCLNNAVNSIDQLGELGLEHLAIAAGIAIVGYKVIYEFFEYLNKKSIKKVKLKYVVKECEVLVLIGHGDSDPFEIEMESKETSAAGYIGCFAAYTNKKIPENQRAPGSPINHDFEDTVMRIEEEYKKAYKAIVDGADSKAREICNKKDAKGCPLCKEVAVNFQYAFSGDAVTDQNRPTLPTNYTIPCPCPIK